MLSAAHVLAMDSKNLLDVVDAIRIKYPEIDPYAQNHKETMQNAMPASKASDNESEISGAFHPNLPQPVNCSYVQYPLYTQNVSSSSTTAPTNVNSGQIVDS